MVHQGRSIIAIVYALLASQQPHPIDAGNINRSCLPNAEESLEKRRNVTFQGESFPLRILPLAFSKSSFVKSEIAKILFEEKLGLYAELLPAAPSSWSGYRALAGCTSMDSQLGPCNVAKDGKLTSHAAHLLFEAWEQYIPDNYEEKIGVPSDLSPTLMELPFEAEEAMCLKHQFAESIYNERGLDLTFYRSFDARWHTVSHLFNTTADVVKLAGESPLSCSSNLSYLFQGRYAQWYLEHTDDADGVTTRSDGSLVAACDHGWWYSPSCRLKPHECIPFVTLNSWLVHAVMQWSVFFRMPLALGTYSEEKPQTRRTVIENANVLFYETFPAQEFSGGTVVPDRIMFPETDPAEVKEGLFRTAFARQKILKGASRHLQEMDDRAYKLFQRIGLHRKDVEDVYKMSRTRSDWQTACDWLRSHTILWSDWLAPKVSYCDAGKYLQGGRCSDCPKGRFSRGGSLGECLQAAPGKYVSERGQTEEMLCPKGTLSTNLGSEICTTCEPGKFTNETGKSTACKLCPQGTYSAKNGSDACTPCGLAGAVTQYFVPATSELACFCPENTYFNEHLSQCTKCPDSGVHCPGGFKLTDLVPDSTVKIKEGFMTVPEEPLSVFRCFAGSHRCPGMRSPWQDGTSLSGHSMCATGSRGISCGTCIDGFSTDGEICVACGGLLEYRFRAVAMMLVLSIFICGALFDTSQQPFHPIKMTLTQLLKLLQSLGVIFQYKFAWPSSFDIPLDIGATSSFDFSRTGALRIDCISGSTFIKRLIFRLCQPLILLFGFFMFALLNRSSVNLIQRCLGRKVDNPIVFIPSDARCLRIYNNSQNVPLEERLSWYWPVRWVNLKRAILTTHFTLFIAFTNAGMAIFCTNDHPNGKATLRSFPEVLVHGSQWWIAFPFSLAALLVYTVFFFALVAYLVRVAPRRFGNSSHFRYAYGRLWLDYHPRCWWFCLVDLIYGLSFNIINATASYLHLQVLVSLVVSISYIVLCCAYQPYLFYVNNRLSFSAKVATTALLLLMTLKMDGENYNMNEERLGVLMVCVALLPFVVGCVLISNFLWTRRVQQSQYLSTLLSFSQKLDDVTRLVSFMSSHELRRFTWSLLDRDVETLSEALDLLTLALLGLQPKSVFRRRVEDIPFQHASPIRLEAELAARGIKRASDVRDLSRRLQADFGIGNSDTNANSTKANLEQLVNYIAGDAQGISSEQFVERMCEYEMNNALWSPEDFEMLFKHLDVDMSGSLTKSELQACLFDAVCIEACPTLEKSGCFLSQSTERVQQNLHQRRRFWPIQNRPSNAKYLEQPCPFGSQAARTSHQADVVESANAARRSIEVASYGTPAAEPPMNAHQHAPQATHHADISGNGASHRKQMPSRGPASFDGQPTGDGQPPPPQLAEFGYGGSQPCSLEHGGYKSDGMSSSMVDIGSRFSL